MCNLRVHEGEYNSWRAPLQIAPFRDIPLYLKFLVTHSAARFANGKSVANSLGESLAEYLLPRDASIYRKIQLLFQGEEHHSHHFCH